MKPIPLPDGKKYHLFIGYSSSPSDRNIALEIDKLLSRRGFNCCIHERDFIVGSSLINNFIYCIEQSVNVVFLLSNNFLSSERCQFELTYTIPTCNWNYPILLNIDGCERPNITTCFNYLRVSTSPEEWICKLEENLYNNLGKHSGGEFGKPLIWNNEHEVLRYAQLLEEGNEERHYVRLIVVGEQAVGKSCLVRRLLMKDIGDVEPTDCMDVQIDICGIDLDTREWQYDAAHLFDGDARLRTVFNNTKLQAAPSEKDPNDRTCNVEVLYSRESHELVMNQRSDKTSFSELLEKQRIGKEQLHAFDADLNRVNRFSYNTKRLARLSIWDFAGHLEYYPTHQLFLSRTCIVILVTDIRKNIADLATRIGSPHCIDMSEQPIKYVAEYIDYWFGCVHCFGETRLSIEEKLDPPIMIVATHTDKITDDLPAKKKEYQRQLFKAIQADDKRGHFRKIFFLSNTNPDETEFCQLKSFLYDLAHEQENWGMKVPLKWIPLEKRIDELKENGEKIFSFDQIRKINDETICPISNDTDFMMFLRLHHDLGNLIFFEDAPDHIIVSPQWFIQALRCIVSAKEFQSELVHLKWKDYEESGRIGEEMIRTIFKSKDPKLLKYQEHIMRLMELYDIVVPVAGTINNSIEYYGPCMIRTSSIDTLMRRYQQCERSSILCFEYNFLPPMFFCHVVVYFLRRYQLSKNNGVEEFYRGACIFDIDATGCEKVLLCKVKNVLQVQVLRWTSQETDSGRRIRIDVEDDLAHIHQKYKMTETKKYLYQLKVKCEDCQLLDLNSMVELSKIEASDKNYFCSKHGHPHNSNDVMLTWSLTKPKIDEINFNDEEWNFIRVGKVSTEILQDILYDLAKKDLCPGIKPRYESDTTNMYAALRKQNIRIPTNGWGGFMWPNERDHVQTGDDIERIRLTRNRLQHSSHYVMTNSEYSERMSNLKRLCERFDVLLQPSEPYADRLVRLRSLKFKEKDLITLIKEFPRIIKQGWHNWQQHSDAQSKQSRCCIS